MVDAYADRRTAAVLSDTWGHLAPDPARTYTGTIVFAHGAFGDIVAVDVTFDDLPDSPWFFDGLTEFLHDQDTEPGKVYRFTGTYRWRRRRHHLFTGTVAPIPLPD